MNGRICNNMKNRVEKIHLILKLQKKDKIWLSLDIYIVSKQIISDNGRDTKNFSIFFLKISPFSNLIYL